MLIGATRNGLPVEVFLNNMRLVHRKSFPMMNSECVNILEKGVADKENVFSKRRLMFLPPVEYPRYAGDANVVFTMFETDSLPSSWGPLINEYAIKLIVPSYWCAETFERHVNVPIEVIPLGINFSDWPYTPRYPSDVFVFLTYGNLSIRKGADVAVEAFRMAFPKKNDVRLVLKTWHQARYYDESIEQDKRVIRIDQSYRKEQMLDLISQADVCLFPSRGEGFGMCSVEAMANGACVMMTNATALRDLCDERYNVPIPITGWTEAAHPHIYEKRCGNWAEPDVKALVERMRWAYNNPNEVAEMGMRSASWVRLKYGIMKAGARLAQSLEETEW